MARVTTVKAARKARKCERCHADIPVGAGYKHVSLRAHKAARGNLRVRCLDCPSWRPSEMTSSAHRATAMAAAEAAYDALGDWDDDSASSLAEILNTMAEGLTEAAEGYREASSNIESGFGSHTSVCDELDEKADQLEQAAQELESWSTSGDEDWDPEAATDEARAALVEERENEDIADDDEELVERVAAKHDEWQDAVHSEAEEAISEAEGMIP